MKVEKFSNEMMPEVMRNEEAFCGLCPAVGTERLNFHYGSELHSATIHFEGGEEVLIYDGPVEF